MLFIFISSFLARIKIVKFYGSLLDLSFFRYDIMHRKVIYYGDRNLDSHLLLLLVNNLNVKNIFYYKNDKILICLPSSP